MSWLSALARPPERRASKTQGTDLRNPSTWLIDLLGGPDSATGIKVTEDSALTSNAVWGCIRVLTETIAALPLHVYRNLPDGGKAKAPEYPLYELLHDAPNPEMSSMEWREATVGHLALWGNSYSEIEYDQAYRPIAIWPLRPDHMFVWRNPDTRQLEYIYQLWQGGSVTLGADRVLHTRTLSRDGILGLSPIGQQREAIGFGLALERYGGALFGNGANPGGILSVPGVLSEPAKTNMKNSWDSAHRGPGNAGRTAVLEQGVTWQQVGMPPEDAQFILSRQFSLQDVCRIYRMPPHKVQDLSRGTFSNIEQESLEFVTDTLLPYLVRSEQAYWRSLIPRLERKRYFIRHSVDALLRGDLPSRYAAYAVGRQWGWLSADDIREREDMNPIPNGAGSDYLVPLNMVPAGQPPPVPAPSPEPPATPAKKGMGGDPQLGRMLTAFLEDVGRRLVAREDADICRAARKWLGRRRPEEFRRWLGGFIEQHRGFIAQQAIPAFRVVDPEFAEELADEFAERHLRELGCVLAEFASPEELESRLAVWREERPAALAEHEARRVLRWGLLEFNHERRAEPQIRIENLQPAVHVETHPAPVTIAEGAVRVENHPGPITIADGAIQVENHIAAAPAPAVHIEPGAVQVEVQPPGLTIAEGAMQVDVQPPGLTIEEGAVQVDVAAPPAPPPAEVRIEEGAVQVEVQASAPAEVNIAEGAVQVDIQPPPPAQVTIEEGAVQVDVAPAQAPQVIFEEGAVRVEPPRPRPKPRLEAMRRQLAERKKEKPDG